jgi:hypothetical protein
MTLGTGLGLVERNVIRSLGTPLNILSSQVEVELLRHHLVVGLDALSMSMSFLTVYKVIYLYVAFEFAKVCKHIGKLLKKG